MSDTFKKRLSQAAIKVGGRVFKPDELRTAYRKLRAPDIPLHTPMARIAYAGLRGLSRVTNVHEVAEKYLNHVQGIGHDPQIRVYDHHLLHLMLNRIYDLPEVEIDPTRPPTVNVLVPAFDFRSMSAGFFGVFQIARFARSCGYNARCVMFDNFYYNESEFRQKFREYPGLETLYDDIEIEYIGERRVPLRANPGDVCAATVWYSAHFADKIMKKISGRPFIYLIQDYETNFFPGGALSTQADNSYELNYHALFSTRSLMDYCGERGIDRSQANGNLRHYFNNACAASLMPRAEFLAVNGAKPKRNLVYYARPIVNRNMFELGALALIEAYRQNILRPEEWSFYSVGLGEGRIDLEPGVSVEHLPRMTLKEYTDNIGRFDLGLSLMASPHPSLLPMDLAGSGCICVTNTYGTKTPEYLTGISRNILAAKPDLRELVRMLAVGAERSKDLEARYDAARQMRYPRVWEETFDDSHRTFVKRAMEWPKPA